MKSITADSSLVAYCGLYCGACYHYRASFYDDERLRAEAARRGRDPAGFTCQGCRSEFSCPTATMQCLRQIAPEDVAGPLEEILGSVLNAQAACRAGDWALRVVKTRTRITRP